MSAHGITFFIQGDSIAARRRYNWFGDTGLWSSGMPLA